MSNIYASMRDQLLAVDQCECKGCDSDASLLGQSAVNCTFRFGRIYALQHEIKSSKCTEASQRTNMVHACKVVVLLAALANATPHSCWQNTSSNRSLSEYWQGKPALNIAGTCNEVDTSLLRELSRHFHCHWQAGLMQFAVGNPCL